MKRVLGARGEDEARDWWVERGDFSSSETAGLGGREACMISSSFSMQVKTLALSDRVTFCTASMTLSSELSVLVRRGEVWQEGEEEEEEDGEGVSLRMGTGEDSMAGLRVVMILDTAIRLGGKEAREK